MKSETCRDLVGKPWLPGGGTKRVSNVHHICTTEKHLPNVSFVVVAPLSDALIGTDRAVPVCESGTCGDGSRVLVEISLSPGGWVLEHKVGTYLPAFKSLLFRATFMSDKLTDVARGLVVDNFCEPLWIATEVKCDICLDDPRLKTAIRQSSHLPAKGTYRMWPTRVLSVIHARVISAA